MTQQTFHRTSPEGGTITAAGRLCLFTLTATLAIGITEPRSVPAAEFRAHRPQDSIWLITSRGSNRVCGASNPDLSFHRLESTPDCGGGRWQRAELDSFLHEDQLGGVTVFFVHGNRVDAGLAVTRGLRVYRSLVRHATGERPIRFVIFRWPAERVAGPAQDARIKAGRTIPAAHHLAWVASRIDPDVPVGLMGFSYGARVITGALHLIGGGKLGAYRLAETLPNRPHRFRAVLMTAALDDDWLLPGRFHGHALRQVDRMLLLNNSCDRALKWYPWLDRCRKPQALGRFGVASCRGLGEESRKIAQRDAGQLLGKVHDLERYLVCPTLMAQAWSYVCGGNLP